MIARLLFKTFLSLGILFGVVSYGHYLAGGDPGAIWGRVAGGALDDMKGSLGELRGKASAVASSVPSVGSGGDDGAGGSRRDSVWTWRDADGVLHYSSAPPAGADATRVTVDPDVNVLAPVVLPDALRTSSGGAESAGAGGARSVVTGGAAVTGAARSRTTRARGEPAESETLPGIAGAILGARGDAPAPDPAQAEALLRLLQPTSR